MKNCKLLYWIRRDGDRRDEASDVAEVTVEQRRALAVAREIDRAGFYGDLLGYAVDRRAARGHGVTVVYAGGRKRNVRAEVGR